MKHIFPIFNRKPIRHTAGFTLIELMVGILIALLTVLLVIQVFSITNMRKRELSGSSDAQQTASLTMNYLVGAIKQAGSSMARAETLWGCTLNVRKDGTNLVPAALPEPFDEMPTQLRVAPILVKAGSTNPAERESDTLLIMSGVSESASIAFRPQSAPTASTIKVDNSNGFLPGDLMLISADDGSCKVLQVGPGLNITNSGGKLDPTPTDIPVGGSYLGDDQYFSGSSLIYNLGKHPQFQLITVKSDEKLKSLMAYDLLHTAGATAPTSIGENVVLFRMLYGIDDGSNGGKANDGIVDSWVSPGSSGWTFTELQSDTGNALMKIGQIKAIRIALVVRGSYRSRDYRQEDLELFAALKQDSLKQTITLTPEERLYHYQVYETVIPIINMRS